MEVSFVYFLMFVLSGIGLTHVIVDGTGPVEKLRMIFSIVCNFLKIGWFAKVVECYLCCGCWCGWLSVYFWFPGLNLVQLFGMGCLIGLMSQAMAIFLNLLEANSIVKNE